MPAITKRDHTSQPAENPVPDLSTDALRSLTQKIETSLTKQGRGTISREAAGRPKAALHHVKKTSGESVAKALDDTAAVKTAGNCFTPIGVRKLTVASKMSEGKKRLRNGRLKEESSRSEVDKSLGQEIRALGGTKEDVDLIADVASDSEMEGKETRSSKHLGNGLEKEIVQFVRQLGVDRLAKKELMTDSDSEDAIKVEGRKENEDANEPSSNTMVIGVKPASQAATFDGKGSKSLIFQPQSGWLTNELPPLSSPIKKPSLLPSDLTDRLCIYARTLLENENKQYAKSNRSASSTHRFFSTIMSTGTLSDKISALTLSVQESPVHNMKALESLVGMARKRNRGQAVEVLGALKDLFGPGNLLPTDRKLRAFSSQPALANAFDPINFNWTSRDPLPEQIKEVYLILWAYEDWLKSTFFEVLKVMEIWCNDEVVFARGKAVDYVYHLLKEKPEQEANLLRLLVNKLGDSNKKIASKTSFNILQLEAAHPLMKPTIIAAIESDVLFRPSQSLQAKYYACITLNQTVLSGKEGIVARKLLDIYFCLFIKLLEKSEEEKPTATAVNLISFNRKGEVQGGGGSAGKKARKRLAEEGKATANEEDLREKMLSAVLVGVNRAIPFTDTKDESFERHLDTLFKVTHSSNFNTSVQALMLIQQLSGSHHVFMDRFYRTLYESLLDPRLLTSSKQALYLNLLFRALRSDLNVKRIKSFAKRLLQVVTMHQPSFICGAIYLVREIEGFFPNLGPFIDKGAEDSDGEEDFRDVQEPLPNGKTSDEEPCPLRANRFVAKYDGKKRDPTYSNADRSSLWEATPFLQHYHPSVALFATRLLAHNEMPPKPDLALNTLVHFLDRFVYRNPKATNAPRGASIMQPMAGGDSSAMLISAYSDKSSTQQPVNSEAFWKQESEKVNADEVFFHKYFSTLGRGREKVSKKKTERKAGINDSADEGDEEEILKLLLESNSELDESNDSSFGDEETEIDSEEVNDDGLDLELIQANRSAGGKLADGAEGIMDFDNEDNEAFLDGDEEVTSELEDTFDQESSSSQPKPAVERVVSGKHGSKRRRLKGLPTFAAADDYAKMLEEDN